MGTGGSSEGSACMPTLGGGEGSRHNGKLGEKDEVRRSSEARLSAFAADRLFTSTDAEVVSALPLAADGKLTIGEGEYPEPFPDVCIFCGRGPMEEDVFVWDFLGGKRWKPFCRP